jgi:hypothetical protein
MLGAAFEVVICLLQVVGRSYRLEIGSTGDSINNLIAKKGK